MRDKGQRFLQSITADAENPVYENANVSRETSILTTTGRRGEAHLKPSLITQPPTHHVSRETIAITKSRRES